MLYLSGHGEHLAGHRRPEPRSMGYVTDMYKPEREYSPFVGYSRIER